MRICFKMVLIANKGKIPTECHYELLNAVYDLFFDYAFVNIFNIPYT